MARMMMVTMMIMIVMMIMMMTTTTRMMKPFKLCSRNNLIFIYNSIKCLVMCQVTSA